ncbi:MAG: hypothetical protein WBC48_00335 [Minisyncoccales bacterium]
MIDKKILLGGGALAAAGIIGGALMYSGQMNRQAGGDQAAPIDPADKAKIEQLYWDELRDKDKYSFCLGSAKIESAYSDSLLNANGLLKHDSRELLVYNKESQKLYVMAREIEFSYRGSFSSMMGDLSVTVPVEEKGSLSESYSKAEMPIRIDYANNYIAADPGTKTANWVYADMGGETEMTAPRTGCAGVYTLNEPGKLDLPAGTGMAAVDRDCTEKDISGAYDGTFSFECQSIDYDQAVNLYDEIKTKETLQNTRDKDLSEINDSEAGGDAADLEKAISGGKSNETQPDTKKALEELKQEMNASQREPN